MVVNQTVTKYEFNTHRAVVIVLAPAHQGDRHFLTDRDDTSSRSYLALQRLTLADT